MLDSDTKQFYDELGGLQEMVDNYEKWVNTADKIADEAMEISRQLEQCRVSRGKITLVCQHLGIDFAVIYV